MNAFSIPGAPGWFNLLVSLSVQAAFLAALIWIVLKMFGRWIPPAWRALIWSLVILRALLPFSPPSQFSLQNLFVTPNPLSPPPAIHVERPSTPPTLQITHESASNIVYNPVVHTLPIEQPRAQIAPQPIGKPLAVGWTVGATFFLILLIARSLLIRRRLLRDGIPASTSILEIVCAARDNLRLRWPLCVTVSDHIASPALTGFIPARLIIPTSFSTRKLTPAQMRHILLHELAHIQQGHLLLHWLALIARAVHWFNPAIHFAAARLRQQCELAADAIALRNSTPEERAAYGETLLQVLAQSSAPPTVLALGMAEEARHLQQRLHALASPPKRTFHVLGMVFIAVIAAAGLTGAVQPESVSITAGNLQGQADHQFIRNKNALSSGRLSTLRNEQLRDSPLMEDARRLIEIGRLEEAKNLLKRALEEDPENHAARYYLNLIQEQRWATTFTPVAGSERFNVDVPDKFVITQTLTPVESNQARAGTSSDAAVIVTIAKTEPYFYLNEKAVTFERLKEELAARAKENPKVAISIRADTDAPVGPVVRVMDAAKAANIKDVNISRAPPADIEKSWNFPAGRELLPTPNPFARTNSVYTSPARQRLYRKLETIRIDEFPLAQETDLVEVLKRLGNEARRRDPEGRGVNLIISKARERKQNDQALIDPVSGVALEPEAEHLDPEVFKVKFDPPIHDVTLGQFLDAVVMVARPPQPPPSNAGLRYSVEDYAIVFSVAQNEPVRLYSRTYRVDPNTFRQGLEGISYSPNPFRGLTSGGQVQTNAGGFFQFRANTPASANGGVDYVTTVTNIAAIQNAVRAFFAAAGVEFATNNIGAGAAVPAEFGRSAPGETQKKAIFFNDRTGVLMVRATLQELDIIENAIHALRKRPKVKLDVRVYETSAAALPEALQMVVPNPPLAAPSPRSPTNYWMTANQVTTFLNAARQDSQRLGLITNVSALTFVGQQARIPIDPTDIAVNGNSIVMLDVIISDDLQKPGSLESSCVITIKENIPQPKGTLPSYRVRQTMLDKKRLPAGAADFLVVPVSDSSRVPVFGGDVPTVGPVFQRVWLILVTPSLVE